MKKILHLILIFCIVLALSSCLPGDESDLDQGETSRANSGSSLNIKILDVNNQIVRTVQTNQTVTVIATFTTTTYSEQNNQVMTFSSDYGVFSPETATALTNSLGVATIELITNSTLGAGTLNASVTTDEETLSVSYNYTVSADATTTDTTTTGDTTTEPVIDTGGLEDLPSDAVIGSISYVDTNPTTITLLGTGGTDRTETAVVTFKLLNSKGLPIPDKKMNFSINTKIGGLHLDPASNITNSRGEASTIVYAGTIPSVVRVTATANVTSSSGDIYKIFTQSDKLVVSTGVPDQNSLSISVRNFNPEAADFVGVNIPIGVRLGDLFNNIVPDGTAVYFSTEGGTIEPSCLTIDGGCSVAWSSGRPLPSNHRITIIATAIGNESFIDADGDGFFSDSDGEPFIDLNFNNIFDEPFVDDNGNFIFDEPFTDVNGDGSYTPSEPFIDHNKNGIYDGNGNNPAGETIFTDSNAGNSIYDGSGRIPNGENYTDMNGNAAFDGPGFSDLGEPFLDNNENFKRDQDEIYFDTNKNGIFDVKGDSKFNGSLCINDSNCSTDNSIHLRTSAIIIASGSKALIDVLDADTNTLYASNHLPSANSIDYVDTEVKINIRLTDTAGQVLPSITTLNVYEDNLLTKPQKFTVPNSIYNEDTLFQLTYTDNAPSILTPEKIIIVTTTPSGINTYLTVKLNH